MYHTSIKEYLSNAGSCRNKISRFGKISKPYQEFLQHCKDNRVDLGELEAYSFQIIKFCILNNLPAPKCLCGKPTLYNRTKNSEIYAVSCSIECRSRDKRFCKAVSDKKTELYKDAEWKNNVESRKVNTCVKNHGVKYPMQDINIFAKQQKSCFSKDENGLHGYEPNIYPFLLGLYPDVTLGIRYLKENSIDITWVDSIGISRRSYPDFFSKLLNSFIEVKGDYTYTNHYDKIMKCKDRLNEMQYGYIIAIVRPGKSFTFQNYNIEYIEE